MTLTIEVEIERLVLTGFARSDRYRIGLTLRNELMQLFAARGVPASLSQDADISRLPSGEFTLTPNTAPGVIGTRVARLTYRALER